jgi:hypothetical protein
MISTPDPSAAMTATHNTTLESSTDESVESRLSEACRSSRLSAWTQGPVDWIFALTGRLEHVPDRDRRQDIDRKLHAAVDLIVLRQSWWAWRQRFSHWWNGTLIEAVTTLLDEAAIRFIHHADDEGLRLALDDAVEYAETLPADDPMRVRFEETLAAWAEGISP